MAYLERLGLLLLPLLLVLTLPLIALLRLHLALRDRGLLFGLTCLGGLSRLGCRLGLGLGLGLLLLLLLLVGIDHVRLGSNQTA